MGVASNASAADLGDLARAELADLIDAQMAPLGLAAIEALAPEPGTTVLDIGCGAGQTVQQLAERVGASGRVIGVDTAPHVLAVARRRTAGLSQVTLLQEDAGLLALPDGSVDTVFSRFGTMFFADPVRAFGSLRRTLSVGGRISFVCWRPCSEIELDTVPLRAAGLEPPSAGAAYSMERRDVIKRVLRQAGFRRITVTAHDADVSCGNAATTLRVVTRVGALGMVLRQQPTLRFAAEAKVLAALLARERNGVVALGAATWIVTAAAA